LGTFVEEKGELDYLTRNEPQEWIGECSHHFAKKGKRARIIREPE
jgi:hypothetical protein